MKNQKRKISFDLLFLLNVLLAIVLAGCSRTAEIRKYYENVNLAENAIREKIKNIRLKQLPIDVYGPSDCAELEKVLR